MKFLTLETFPENIFWKSILKGLNPSKEAGYVNVGKFLKDSTDVLVVHISQLCNLSIKLNSFSRSWKTA